MTCLHIVKVIPPFSFQPNGTDDMESIGRYLIKKCISRYQEILTQNMQNDIIIKSDLVSHQIGAVRLLSANYSKPKLLILDLDLTLIDQGSHQNGPFFIIDDRHRFDKLCTNVVTQNARALHFGLFRRECHGKQCGYLVTYRQFLLHLIDTHRRSTNFVIYSLADITHVIRHIILIEMFFNFVYRFHSVEKFEFSYVIARLRDKSEHILDKKSLATVTHVIGDLSHFESIFIVDDRAGDVWKNDTPSALIENACNIFPIAPPKFQIKTEYTWGWRFVIHSIKNQKGIDRFLDLLTEFIKMSHRMTCLPHNNSLKWITAGRMETCLASQGVRLVYNAKHINPCILEESKKRDADYKTSEKKIYV